MIHNILTTLRMLVLMTLITGVAYPGLMLLTGKTLFPEQAGGSLVYADTGADKSNGTAVVGSALVAQGFSNARYFWPRPSASGYAAVPSGASQLSPASKKLRQAVDERRSAAENAHEQGGREMLFASGSGLDPDISPESARAQIPRILKARGLNDASGAGRQRLEALVRELTQGRDWGFLGQERVNVLRLNRALDAIDAIDAPDAPDAIGAVDATPRPVTERESPHG